MTSQFFDQPILNSPYAFPARHWELDETGQPTGHLVDERRVASFLSPIPSAKGQVQKELGLDEEGQKLESKGQQYELMEVINGLRRRLDAWRALPDPNQWRVTPETARLLKHWRSHPFADIRPFFCQIEAAEAVIWLTEVAPRPGREGRDFLERLKATNEQANRGLSRLALKLATGAGKTTVMAMLIAWQTINAVRRPASTGEIRSDDADGIACWFIDTDYDAESFFVRHAYFLGAGDPYKALKTTLRAEINEGAWATLHSDISRPFPRPASGQIAVKVINHLGDEVMKVFRV